MKEYYKNAEATEEYFWTDKDGVSWGCTGDIGYIDEDGLLFVLGRMTDSCILDTGEKDYLFDIEEEVIKDETVNQCKVVDTELDGKIVLVCHIVLGDGVENVDSVLKRINNNLRENFPDYMVPGYYKLRESMPVHSNGKRDVETLRKEKEGLLIVKD